MQPKRLFIGISLSPELVKRLERERRDWEQYPFFLVPKENLHVTLLFLGYVDEEEIEHVCDEMRSALDGVASFEMDFHEIGFVQNDRDPSMVWLKGEVSEELKEIRKRLEMALGYRHPEAKRFRPHVNLARVRKQRFAALSVKPILTKSVRLVEPVSSVTLFEVVTHEGKRRYGPLCEIELDA